MDFDQKWDETLMAQWEETKNDRAPTGPSPTLRCSPLYASHRSCKRLFYACIGFQLI
jgi:hypothetical protein